MQDNFSVCQARRLSLPRQSFLWPAKPDGSGPKEHLLYRVDLVRNTSWLNKIDADPYCGGNAETLSWRNESSFFKSTGFTR